MARRPGGDIFLHYHFAGRVDETTAEHKTPPPHQRTQQVVAAAAAAAVKKLDRLSTSADDLFSIKNLFLREITALNHFFCLIYSTIAFGHRV